VRPLSRATYGTYFLPLARSKQERASVKLLYACSFYFFGSKVERRVERRAERRAERRLRWATIAVTQLPVWHACAWQACKRLYMVTNHKRLFSSTHSQRPYAVTNRYHRRLFSSSRQVRGGCRRARRGRGRAFPSRITARKRAKNFCEAECPRAFKAASADADALRAEAANAGRRISRGKGNPRTDVYRPP